MIERTYYVIQINNELFLKNYDQTSGNSSINLTINACYAVVFRIEIARKIKEWIKETFKFDSNIVEITVENITHKIVE